MSYTFNHACCKQLYESISRRHEQAELARNKLIDNFSNLKLLTYITQSRAWSMESLEILHEVIMNPALVSKHM